MQPTLNPDPIFPIVSTLTFTRIPDNTFERKYTKIKIFWYRRFFLKKLRGYFYGALFLSVRIVLRQPFALNAYCSTAFFVLREFVLDPILMT